MSFMVNLRRFASLFAICLACVGLIGFALYYLYGYQYGLNLGLSCVAVSSVFQAIRLWPIDRARGFVMLVTAGCLFGAIFFF